MRRLFTGDEDDMGHRVHKTAHPHSSCVNSASLIGANGADVRLKLGGLASLVRDLGSPPGEPARTVA